MAAVSKGFPQRVSETATRGARRLRLCASLLMEESRRPSVNTVSR
jgi:hypothetical protein